VGGVFACTEQGIRDAITVGGGPHTFDCDDPVVTESEIIIHNDVILDGQGNLTVDGNEDHPVLFVAEGVTAQLHGFTITNGLGSRKDLLISAGIANEGTLTLSNSKVSGNRSSGGGSAIANNGTLTIANSEVSGNAGPQGAGILNRKLGALILRNSTVSGNTAHTAGGIFNEGALAITNSTVSGNVGEISGGILNYSWATLTLTNSTVSGNVAELLGGGGITNRGTLTLTHSTVSGNTPPYLDSGPGSVTLRGTIFDTECPPSGAGGSYGGPFASLGYNIESPGDTCGFDQTGDQVGVTAEQLNLGELADNGGPTMTHALLPGSVAIDVIPADMCEVDEDQRGFARDSMCDVGAFEVQPAP
jgi:hypothetical protein